MFVLWRLLGVRRLLALLVLRKAWRMYRSRKLGSSTSTP
jgi:hypothetical protein